MNDKMLDWMIEQHKPRKNAGWLDTWLTRRNAKNLQKIKNSIENPSRARMSFDPVGQALYANSSFIIQAGLAAAVSGDQRKDDLRAMAFIERVMRRDCPGNASKIPTYRPKDASGVYAMIGANQHWTNNPQNLAKEPTSRSKNIFNDHLNIVSDGFTISTGVQDEFIIIMLNLLLTEAIATGLIGKQVKDIADLPENFSSIANATIETLELRSYATIFYCRGDITLNPATGNRTMKRIRRAARMMAYIERLRSSPMSRWAPWALAGAILLKAVQWSGITPQGSISETLIVMLGSLGQGLGAFALGTILFDLLIIRYPGIFIAER